MADLEEDCGCTVRWSTGAEVAGIDFCDMHSGARDTVDKLDQHTEGGRLIFAICASGLPGGPQSPQEYAESLCALLEKAAQIQYDVADITVRWWPTRARLDALIDRERRWSRPTPTHIAGAPS